MDFKFYRIKSYLTYFARAHTIYDVHSPFLFDMLNFVLDKERIYYDFEHLDKIRRHLAFDYTPIHDQDPGAGTTVSKRPMTVSDVAQYVVSDQYTCELLYRLVAYFKPKNILELGTSLGVSALYLAAPMASGKVYTLEGRSSIATIANQIISKQRASNIHIVEGLFEDTLESVLNEVAEIDLVVLDGNHKYLPTLAYASAILKQHVPKVMVVDDIYWSPEMTEAWRELKKLDVFQVAIDFYDFGLLIHRPEISEKIDMAYIDYYKKFWRMGFFN